MSVHALELMTILCRNEWELKKYFWQPLTTSLDIAAFPESVNVLPEVKGDVRTPDKLVDGSCDTDDGRHMWLAPLLPGGAGSAGRECVLNSSIAQSYFSSNYDIYCTGFPCSLLFNHLFFHLLCRNHQQCVCGV